MLILTTARDHLFNNSGLLELLHRNHSLGEYFAGKTVESAALLIGFLSNKKPQLMQQSIASSPRFFLKIPSVNRVVQ